jgi:hypothetical protein
MRSRVRESAVVGMKSDAGELVHAPWFWTIQAGPRLLYGQPTRSWRASRFAHLAVWSPANCRGPMAPAKLKRRHSRQISGGVKQGAPAQQARCCGRVVGQVERGQGVDAATS